MPGATDGMPAVSTMRAWLRLYGAEWTDALRTRPWRRVALLLAWWVPWILLPLAACSSPGLATTMTGLLLGLDVPLALLLAAGTVIEAWRLRERAAVDAWLWPGHHPPRPVKWLRRARWLVVVRWPLGIILAACLLRASLPDAYRNATEELWLMGTLALATGLGFVWVLGHRSGPHDRAPPPRRARGLAALSWAPIHEARDRLALHRLPVLLVPALLAAPAGARFHEAVEVALVFLAVMTIALCLQQAGRVQALVRSWLRDARLSAWTIAWWSWKHVAATIVAVIAAGLLLPRLWPPGTTP